MLIIIMILGKIVLYNSSRLKVFTMTPTSLLNERLLERLSWRKERRIGGRLIMNKGRERIEWESGVQERKTDTQASVIEMNKTGRG